ncbi:hypothetical protein [Bradyrhizobium valentinum]|uniref:Uncharacterized protein n=1 Tax=Bradyrhizobium valentinum TaxID=1518501 RepID=A0A0R3L298_9BRAD|nr:hypothetical protein [Bradyrhizobium valentinum]KRR02089.1 hypothetical protein CP49_04720 [Bradyrhizobium valentinum]
MSFSSLRIIRQPIDLVIAPVELPFMGERENESRDVQMVDVVGFLMVIAAHMALPNAECGLLED